MFGWGPGNNNRLSDESGSAVPGRTACVSPKFGTTMWGSHEMVQTASIKSAVVIDCTTERTTDVKLDGISLKWMRLMMSGLDHHHVGSTMEYHILETTLGGPA